MTILYILIGIVFVIIIILIPVGLFRKFDIRRKKRLQFALLAFQSHTNPHFIKNVLQAINWFILNNEKDLASDYLCDFSRLMEDILKFSKKNFVSLLEKLEFLDLYLKLQHLRHTDKFDYYPLNSQEHLPTIQIDGTINPEVFLLPPLLIHPYIENAIEHGLKAKKSKGNLYINFEFRFNKLICIIADNGIGVIRAKKMQTETKQSRSNIGIINAQKRIEIIRKLYRIDIQVEINELYPGEIDPGTKVTIVFPMPLIFSPVSGMPQEIYNV